MWIALARNAALLLKACTRYVCCDSLGRCINSMHAHWVAKSCSRGLLGEGLTRCPMPAYPTRPSATLMLRGRPDQETNDQVVHMDIKPANILLDDINCRVAKLADLGVSRYLVEGSLDTITSCGMSLL